MASHVCVAFEYYRVYESCTTAILAQKDEGGHCFLLL